MINVYFLLPLTLILLFFTEAINKKIVCLLCLAIVASTCVFAQKSTKIDTIIIGNGTPGQQIKQSKAVKKQLLSDSTGGNEPQKSSLVDTTVKNKYGDLLNDDIKFNKKYPVWKPVIEVLGIN